ncbi:hypothetical protein X750_29845 [Mesorhizobium sp. LNJC394B00]|nr:hypothetical protein X750_29845 [Mesorhizobium sp. LNJC394B00]
MWRTVVISRGTPVEYAPLTKSMSKKLLFNI